MKGMTKQLAEFTEVAPSDSMVTDVLNDTFTVFPSGKANLSSLPIACGPDP